MKQTSLYVLSLFSFALLFSSCATNLYTPNEAYMLGLSNQGDVKVAGAYASNSENLSFGLNAQYEQSNIQLAISPVKHLGLVGSHFRQNSKQFSGVENTSRRHTEVGLGYYSKSKKKKETDQSFVLHDVYAGIGWGQNYRLFETAGELYGNYQRYFLHYGVHLWWKNDVSIGFGFRYARTYFDQIDLIGKVPSSFSREVISEIRRRNPFDLLESTLHIQAGGNYAKVFLSTTGIIRSNQADIGQTYKIAAPIVNLGLVLDLDEIWKKAIPSKKGI